MKKAVAVMVVVSAIIVLSFSSSHAACWSQAGKVVRIEQGPVVAGVQQVIVYILQNGTTNTFWRFNMPLTSPQVQLFGTAMVGGLTVSAESTYTTCPAPSLNRIGTTSGSLVNLGQIINFNLQK